MEGALKLKEISYIHAEGYAAGEMKQAQLRSLTRRCLRLLIAPKDSMYDKMISNIQEIKSRRGPIIGIGTEGDRVLKEMVDDFIDVPRPLIFCIPYSLLCPVSCSHIIVH
jgi:glucosamine--fructose-6-phosphate aminotransferase (isomerizing)